jgi:hypothetical protein
VKRTQKEDVNMRPEIKALIDQFEPGAKPITKYVDHGHDRYFDLGDIFEKFHALEPDEDEIEEFLRIVPSGREAHARGMLLRGN